MAVRVLVGFELGRGSGGFGQLFLLKDRKADRRRGGDQHEGCSLNRYRPRCWLGSNVSLRHFPIVRRMEKEERRGMQSN